MTATPTEWWLKSDLENIWAGLQNAKVYSIKYKQAHLAQEKKADGSKCNGEELREATEMKQLRISNP